MARWVLRKACWGYQDCSVQDNGKSEAEIQRAGNNADSSFEGDLNNVSEGGFGGGSHHTDHLVYGAALPTIAEHDSDLDEEIPLNRRVRYLQVKQQHLWK